MICELADVKQRIASQLFSIFELGDLAKHLFPLDLNVPLGFAPETIEGLRNKTHCFPCLVDLTKYSIPYV